MKFFKNAVLANLFFKVLIKDMPFGNFQCGRVSFIWQIQFGVLITLSFGYTLL